MKQLIYLLPIMFLAIIGISSCSNENEIISPTAQVLTKSGENTQLESDYSLLANYLIIENYRYKLSIEDRDILSLGVMDASLKRFKNEMAVQNEKIAQNEVNPEHYIRMNLPGKDPVIVPTLLKSGKRASIHENVEQIPMMTSLAKGIQEYNSTITRIGSYLGGMNVGESCSFEGKELITGYYYVQSTGFWSFGCRCDIFVVPNEGWRVWDEIGFASSTGSKDWQFPLVPSSGKCWWEFSSINTSSDGSSIDFKFYNKN